MSSVLALCKAELIMLTRNRTAAFNAVLIPLGISAIWIFTDPPAGAASFGAILQLAALAAMTIAASATITLVARRDRQVLERWRSSGIPTASIVGGTVGLLYLLFLAQSALVLGATAYATETVPARPVLAVVGVVLTGALALALAFLTAAFTNTVDASNITSFPAMAALFGGAMWASSVGAGEATWTMLATGGGSASVLIRLGWDGSTSGLAVWEAALPAAGILVALTVAAAVVAVRTFRWGPRP